MNRPEIKKQIQRENSYQKEKLMRSNMFMRKNLSGQKLSLQFNRIELSKTSSSFQNKTNNNYNYFYSQKQSNSQPFLDLERPLTRQLCKITPKKLYTKDNSQQSSVFQKVPFSIKTEITPNDLLTQNSDYKGFSGNQITSSSSNSTKINFFQQTNYKNKVFTEKFFFRQNTKPDIQDQSQQDYQLKLRTQKFYQNCKEFFSDEMNSTQNTHSFGITVSNNKLPSLADQQQNNQQLIQILKEKRQQIEQSYIKMIKNQNNQQQQFSSIIEQSSSQQQYQQQQKQQQQQQQQQQAWNQMQNLVDKGKVTYQNSKQKLAIKKIEQQLFLEQKKQQQQEGIQEQDQNNGSTGQTPYRTFLFVRYEYFDICSSKNSLHYCYYRIPINQYYEREKRIQQQYKKILNNLKEKLKITNDVKVYMYLKDGTILNNHIDIPESEKTIIISVSSFFKGVQMQIQNKERLQRILDELEIPVQLYEQKKQMENTQNTINNNLKKQNKTSFEKQISKKFSPIINSIIYTLNKQKIIKEDEDYADDDEDKGVKDNGDLQVDENNNTNNIQQQEEDEILDFNIDYNLDSKTLEYMYKEIQNNFDKNEFNNQEIVQQQQQPKVFARQWKYKNNVEYLNSQDVLIKTKKIKNLQQIESYYDEELKEVNFAKFESQKEDNQIVERILNRNKIAKKQQEKNNPIRKLAQLNQVFNKVKPREQILCIDVHQDQQLKKEKTQQFMKEKTVCNDCQGDISLSKQEQQEKKKFQITKIISKYMNEFLKELEQHKSELQLKENDQKMLDISDSEIQEKGNENNQKNLFEKEESSLQEEEENSDNSVEVEFEFGEEEDKIGKNIKENMMKVTSKKEVIRAIDKKNQNLFRLNIPQILVEIPQLAQGRDAKHNQLSNLTRYDIHNIYTIYKTLHQVTSQRYSTANYKIDDGIDYEVYRNGLYQIFMQSEDLAKKIFQIIDYNFSGWMDWGEFLKLMVIIRAKTLAEKINLFIKIADQNGDGTLEWDEIKDLSVICLSRYLPEDKKDDDFVDKLCDYFTKLIFQVCGIDHEEEGAQIPFDDIKSTIINGNSQESDLLCMFCGADI